MCIIRLPNAIVVGAPKCGTCSLHSWLAAHPEVCTSPVNENYFLKDDVKRFKERVNVLYPSLEIVLHTAWTFVGLCYLGLAPDLRTFLVKLFSRLRA